MATAQPNQSNVYCNNVFQVNNLIQSPPEPDDRHALPKKSDTLIGNLDSPNNNPDYV